MRNANRQSRRGSVAIGLAIFAGSSARALLAQNTVIFEQNADGQSYMYTAPDGHVITGNFPSDNNWSQSLTSGSYGYSIGSNNYTYPYETAPSNWSTPAYPNSTTTDVLIPGLPVTLDVSVSVHNLTINASGGVSMLAGTSLNIVGPTVTDNGQIIVNSQPAGGATILNFNASTVSGTGVFLLNESTTNAQINGALTQSAGHSIGGYGEINAALTNSGTVNANVSNQTLYLQTSNMTNNSLFQATGGGLLYINTINITQGTGGVISAGTASAVDLYSANISGGTLNSSAGSAITTVYGTNLFASVTNNAQINMQAGTTINVTGNLIDNGQFLINSQPAGGVTVLNFSGGTVSGPGSFLLNESTSNAQINGTLTQSAGHTILGYGEINAAFTNNGTVNANTSGQSLYLLTSNMTNNSLFEATAGGTLYIDGITVTQGTNGLISSGTGSGVTLYSASILGGTLNSSGGSAFTVNSYTTNLLSSITNNAQINMQAGATVNVAGNLVDKGQFLINSQPAGGVTILNFSGGTVSGTGSFLLNESTSNAQINGTLAQSAGHSILGYGEINAVFTNNGTVNANTSSQTLYLLTSNMSNNALFEATGGGALEIDGITVTQSTAGLISATGIGSRINLSGATLSGGTLNTSTGAVIYQSGSPDTFTNLISNAQINMSAGTTINVTGSLTDNGQFLVNTPSAGGATYLNFSGGTVSGTGSFVLNETANNAQITGTLTQSANHSILGFGQISAALTNNGTVNANVTSQTLFLQNSNMSNNATFASSNGGILEIYGITLTQGAAGVINAGINSGISVIDSTINGGVINAANGSTMTIDTSVLNNTTFNSAAGATVVVQGGVSSIGSLMQNPAGSVVDILAGATLNITGNLVDNGKFIIDSQPAGGTTILNFSGGTITGTGSFILNLSGTNAQINGILTQPAGHTIGGYGLVNAALTNNGTVNANVSNQTLYLQTSNMTNNGLFEAMGGALLYINAINITQGTGGVISAGTGSAVQLFSSNISGGTLNSAAGSAITTVNYGINLFASVTNNAQINLQAGTTINVTGNLIDNGQFLINSQPAGGTTVLNFSGGTVSGPGSFLLNESTTNAQINGTLTQSAGHTILGYGEINAALTNNGTVNANTSGQALYLLTSNMTNNSLFEATAGGTLYINGITVTQGTNGSILAGTGSGVTLNSVSILGGTLNSSGGSAFTVIGYTTNLLSSITNNAQINMQAGATINVAGNLVDNGQIVIDTPASGGATILNFSGGTVSGTGSFLLNESTTNAQINGVLTQAASHTILGYGQINATLTNNGTVNANTSGQTLYLDGTTTGTGIFQVSGGGILNVAANLTISAPGSLIGAGAGSLILINSGAGLIDNSSVAGLPAITDNGILIFAANPNTGILTRSLSSLTLGSTGIATVNTAASTSNRTLLITSALNFAGSTNNWGGELNLGNNDLDVVGGSLTNITNQIAEGFNGGNWQGSAGIVSSAAASSSSHLLALGSIQNNQSGTALFTATHLFDGTVPGASDVLVKYTYYGDANLDGKIDGSDYSRIDNGYLLNLTGWYNGDFNYDGIVNGSDYTLIDNAYNVQGAQITAEVAVATSEIGGNAGYSAIPEPAGLGLLVVGAAGMLARRKRRSQSGC